MGKAYSECAYGVDNWAVVTVAQLKRDLNKEFGYSVGRQTPTILIPL